MVKTKTPHNEFRRNSSPLRTEAERLHKASSARLSPSCDNHQAVQDPHEVLLKTVKQSPTGMRYPMASYRSGVAA
ncbi:MULTISPECIES: hypothetical protein [unclassified Mesorhizobium]|uniref:hypothetical protein n=1 Tax=unclassified Mesorhizobium TaxID=325217 RepID=UPI0003CFD548|nr:hypothetical protein [Mesorhizobium sp. L2C066B000]ESZ42951.1 hypothetical protein X732_03355 [Mesorhizobium sp. L2C066B000]